jgi:tetratricopeptide (TPR) repeat protein/O-antigen ligase
MSKLSVFCEKLIEACWLAAITMAPLFFNVYSSRVFEPDKISLVRSLALIMLAAWLTLRAEGIRSGKPARLRGESATPIVTRWRTLAADWSRENPLALPTGFFIAIYILSTLVSVSPSVSLLGSYQRLQGLYTLLAYVTIFFLTASTIRSRAQIDRAISLALVVSFPIAFYGIIQHYFLDPLPWGGDVTTRVASNMGNSIFVGAYLIMVVPLALWRLIQSVEHGARGLSSSGRIGMYVLGFLSAVVIFAFWLLSFEFRAKKLIEANYNGTLTPDMLTASAANFNLALGITFLVVLAWWAAAFILKQRAAMFLLVGLYAMLLAVQTVCLLFTQSRGPFLGFLGAIVTFFILLLVTAWRRRDKVLTALSGLALALVTLITAAGIISLVLLQSGAFRDLPYIGRLGSVFETEGGTGKVRVLIWEGALKLALPHPPLWSPTGGDDILNPLRPLIGYGPETMYVAYNPFYPPELGNLESRNATPDRSHNETFDALVTTGLIGFVAENLVFLSLFYYALKWLGFINSPRERNAFVALWYLTGLAAALVFGAYMGWQFIGVALPAGMIVGFFIYIVGSALLRGRDVQLNQDPARASLLVTLLAVIVAHFIEIHFGIAIVSTRTYFWFLAALLVVVGARQVTELAGATEMIEKAPTEVGASAPGPSPSHRKKSRRSEKRALPEEKREPMLRVRPNELSTTPLIAFAFLTGLILATMAFDYITINSVRNSTFALDIVISALTTKATTAGTQSSYAMLWLFAGTLLVALAIALAEWGRRAVLKMGEWLFVAALFVALAVAVFSAFIFFHAFLIGTLGAGELDALLSILSFFITFMLVTVVVVAITLMFDYRLPAAYVARATTWIVAPLSALVATGFILVPNVSVSAMSVVQADMIYKQALALANGQTLGESIQLFVQALDKQPAQDYYLLFLGRSYLEYAKTLQDPVPRDHALNQAESVLRQARDLNPLQTDHSANLARLHQAWASIASDPSTRLDHYKQSLEYYAAAIRLSPYTVHLYDQHAQLELDYASFLKEQRQAAAAAEAIRTAQDQVARALKIDPTFCLSYAVRAQTQSEWSAGARDALDALKYAPLCGDVFIQEGRAVGLQALLDAGDRAAAAGVGAQFVSLLDNEAHTDPSLELYTALTNFYSKAGQIDQAVQAANAAMALIPSSDPATQQKYQEFRNTLVGLQQAIAAAKAAPNDPEVSRTLAKAWLARGQFEFALSEYQKVVELLPNDYEARRVVTLLLVQQDRLPEASRAITPTLTVAPANERSFWERLGVALDAAQKGQTDAALVTLDDLMKSVDPQDNVTLQALHALSAKLKGQG